MREVVKAECGTCGGTGLYCGMCEPEGTAVVCLRCEGSGAETLSYTPFTRRKGKRGIKIVRNSRGTFILTGVGAVGGSITYKEFQEGILPGEKE